MTEDPLVSVIIPAYNRSKYIDQAVLSVLEQTYQHLELIAVDDGSTDGTYERLLTYGNRIVLLTHPRHQNRGQSASINCGLKVASGRYVIVLDSDDYWALDKLRIQVEFMEAHPEIGLVYTNGYHVSEKGEILFPYHSSRHQEPGDPNSVLLDCYLALPVNSLVRKEIYDRVGGFEERFRASQDHDMLIRIAEVAKFAYLPDFLFYYRRHGDSISKKKQELRWRTGFEILQRAAVRYPYKRSTLRKRRALLHFRLAQVLFNEGRRLMALPHLMAAGALDPLRSLKVLTGIEKKS